MKNFLKILLALLIACMICTPVTAGLPDGKRMDEIGQRAAWTAMNELQFSKGDFNVVVLTDAGRARVEDQTTERAVSGITEVSGLQNGDNTLWIVNRADWKPLWFYFYDKKSGKGVYLEPDTSIYTKSDAEISTITFYNTFSKNVLVTGDLDQMLADTRVGNKTIEDLGENSGVIGIANGWAHGAPYDMMSVVSLHNHFCPGVSSGYILAKYVEQKMPITEGTSYIVISSPHWCKDDVFPILWDLTPGKSGQYISDISMADQDAQKAKYGTSPAGIYIRWDSKAKSGHALVLGFKFDESTATGPSWGKSLSSMVEMVENVGSPEKYVSVIKEFDVNETMLADLKNPVNNPYKVIGM